MVAFEMTCRNPWFTRISIRSLVRERAFVQGKKSQKASTWHDVTGTFQTSILRFEHIDEFLLESYYDMFLI